MKYVIIDENKNGTGDMFTEEYNDVEEAKREAERAWNYLTSREKKARCIYVLESANPNEEAADHFDGIIVQKFEEE